MKLFVSKEAFRVKACRIRAEDVFVKMQLSERNEDFSTDAKILTIDANRLQNIAYGGRRGGESKDFLVDGIEIGAIIQQGREIAWRGRGVNGRTKLMANYGVKRRIM